MDIKKDLDNAIDSSGDSDEKLTDNLVLLHNKYYGKQKTNELIDTLYDDKDSALLQEQIVNDIKNFNMKDANKAVASEIYKGTPEAKYLQPVYDVADPILKAASVLGKPVSVSMAAGRTIGKLGNAAINAINPEYGEELKSVEDLPLYEELSSLFPTQQGSLTADLRENFPQDGFLKGSIPEQVKQKFPKASSTIESVGPYDVADVAAASAIPKIMKLGASGSMDNSLLKTKDRIRSALIRSSDNSQYIHDLNTSGKLDHIVNIISEDRDLINNLNNPKKMNDILSGKTSSYRDEVTGRSVMNKSKVGLIDKAGQDITKEISKHGNIGGVDSNELFSQIRNNVLNIIDNEGSGYKNVSISNVNEEIESLLKNKVASLSAESPVEELMAGKKTPEQIIKIKKGAADKIFESGKLAVMDDNAKLSKLVAQEVWKELDKKIVELAEITNDYGIIKANNKYSDLVTLRDVIGKTPTTSMKKASLVESLTSGALVGGAAVSMGASPWKGMILGGIPAAIRAADGTLSGSMPSYMARAGKIAQKGYGVMSNLPTAPLAVTLASYEIPRNTAQIMKERDLVLAKLAQETNTPEGQVLFDAIHDALMNNPHKVQGLMKVLSDNYPQIFAQDKYQKFDGIVPVQNRKAALKDLNNSKKYSNGQKADKIQRLINEGYLDEY